MPQTNKNAVLGKRRRTKSLLSVEAAVNLIVNKEIALKSRSFYNGKFTSVDWKQAMNVKILTYANVFLRIDASKLTALYLDGGDACTTNVFIKVGNLLPTNMTAVSNQKGVANKLEKYRVEALDVDLINFVNSCDVSYNIVFVDLCCDWINGKKTIIAAIDVCTPNAIFAFAVSRRTPTPIDPVKIDKEIKHHFSKWTKMGYSMKLLEYTYTRRAPSYYVFIYNFCY